MVTVWLPVAGLFCVALPLTAQSQVSCFCCALAPSAAQPYYESDQPKGPDG